MYRIAKALFLVLILCAPSFADDKGVDTLPNLTDNQSLVILNENLNRMDSRTRTLQDSIDAVLPIDLSLYGTTVDGVLPTQGGGTGAATVQGAMDNLTTVASSTTGDVWTSDGSHGNWDAVPAYTPSFASGILSLKTETDSGDASVTVGFQPSKLEFYMMASLVYNQSHGYATGASAQKCVYFSSSGTSGSSTSKIWYTGNVAGYYIHSSALKSIDANGFTYTITKGGDTANVDYVVLWTATK